MCQGEGLKQCKENNRQSSGCLLALTHILGPVLPPAGRRGAMEEKRPFPLAGNLKQTFNPRREKIGGRFDDGHGGDMGSVPWKGLSGRDLGSELQDLN